METDTTRSFSQQLPRNLAANIAYFLASIIIGVLLVPYFVSSLGVAAYGLIPLATSITGYVAIGVQSLDAAVTRFLTVDLQRKDYAAANRTFNTAFLGLTAVILLVLPIVVVVAIIVPAVFNVPSGHENESIILFLGVCSAVLIRAWSGTFTVQLFAFNRLDLQNLVNFTNLIVQTGIILLIFTINGPNLAIIGGAYIIGAIIASALSIILAKRICSELYFSLHFFDRSRIRELFGMGWWVMVDQVGTLLLFQIELIVVNLLFGAILAGDYAIALQWSTTLRTVAGTLVGVLVPTFFAYYALKQTENLTRLSLSAVKFMALAMALPAALICGLAPQLITLWVGAEYADLAPLMVLLTAPLVVNMSVLPLFSINTAHNRVRIPGIMTILFGLANGIIAIALSILTGLGYYGVAIAGIVTLSIRHMVFVPWYTGRVLEINGIRFVQSVFPGTLLAIIFGFFIFIVGSLLSPSTLIDLTIIGAITSIVYLLFVWVLALSDQERQIFKNYIPEQFRDYMARYSQSEICRR